MPQRRETAVVVDRSRDAIGSADFVGLHVDPRFCVTENERRLTDRTLDRCDVLVIQTQAAGWYTQAELASIRRFVRRGGGLLLATVAGGFELRAGRPVDKSAAQQVAGLFGVRFLSPGKAVGRAAADELLTPGFRRRDLALRAGGPLTGMRLDDLAVRHAAPLALPRGARVLLRHRRSREPVAATLSYGRGRVFVASADGLGHRIHLLGARTVAWLAARSRRTQGARPLPDILAARWRRSRRGDLRVRTHGVREARRAAVLALVTDLLGRLRKLYKARTRRTIHVEVVPGTGCHFDRNWSTLRSVLRVGADACRPSLIYDLTCALCACLDIHDGISSLLWRGITPETLHRHLALRMLAAFGFEAEAGARRAVLESWPDGRGDPRRVDLGEWRSEAGPSPGMWVWGDLEAEFGPRLIDRFLRNQPQKFPWKKFPHWDVFTEMDIVIYYLSLAAKEDLFKWFAARGSTVHALPLVPTDDKSFMRRCLSAVKRQFRDVRQPLSERFDAARVLMRARIHQRVRLGREARRLALRDEGERLIAGMRLARARDPRGRAALLGLARGAKDRALAAIAAVTLVEAGDARAADRLAGLAASADRRFQLDAGSALARVGRRIPSPLRVTVRRGTELRCLGEVDGVVGANIFSGPDVECWPGGLRVPRHFVYWVHTAPKWRRKGISRALLRRTLSDRWGRGAAVSALDTGTTNTAHTLYRSAGFIDVWVWDAWSRPLRGAVGSRPVKGVRCRRATDRDVRRMAALFNQVYADYFAVHPKRLLPLFDASVAVVAEDKDGLAGFVRGVLRDPDRKGKVTAEIADICIKPDKRTEKVAQALLARFCTEADRRGAATVRVWRVPEEEAVRRALQATGFVSKREGGVEMWRLSDLPLLLRQITPLLESRLAAKKRNDWCGTISIRGQKHAAALRVTAGKVRVLRSVPRAADIALETDDETLSRIIVGRETVFEAMLQVRLRISPKANRDVTTLLEAMFPKVKMYPG